MRHFFTILILGVFALTSAEAAAETSTDSPADQTVDNTYTEEESVLKRPKTREERKARRAEAARTRRGQMDGGGVTGGQGWMLNPPDRNWRIRGSAELGFVNVEYHSIQLSQDGTEWDYTNNGGQDVLFPYTRLQAELELWKRLNISFLYQPLNFQTRVTLEEAERVDGLDFPEGTPVDLGYNFGFYRLSFTYDFFRAPDQDLAIGLSAQIRNATIEFASVDGSLRRSTRNIGFVPVIKLEGRYTFDNGVFMGTEIDGFYAWGRYVSGSSNDFDGLIVDASIRAGLPIRPVGEVFINLRYLGGGARGTDETPDGPGDGYTNNWLHTMSLSLGLNFR